MPPTDLGRRRLNRDQKLSFSWRRSATAVNHSKSEAPFHQRHIESDNARTLTLDVIIANDTTRLSMMMTGHRNFLNDLY
ncbi:hypothetical protein NDU88_002092 [Pleurodeles waltl]|uniref:Uncharacterized protein n=1 Tax=Pleurodeles waltl TaxID=8319 RepID=A0AAV7Q7Q5_PLEWA|nr:hypothetical protein NDU88_002092 [Pleurodeles waltl]